MIRPGISPEFLGLSGVREVDAATAGQLVSLGEPGIIIPYRTLDGAEVTEEGRPFFRLRLHQPRGKQKYHQIPGSRPQLYFPTGLAKLCASGALKDLVLVEGEFKAMALVEAGVPAAGTSGFYGAMHEGAPLPALVEVLERLKPERILLLGDTDTALNWQFADAAVKLAGALQREITLPRIPFDNPKGIDDCRQEFWERFSRFWSDLVQAAEPVAAKANPCRLAARLACREKAALLKLTEPQRSEALDRLIEIAAWLRDSIAEQQIQDLAAEVFGMKARAFSRAVKAARSTAEAQVKPRVLWDPEVPGVDGRHRIALPCRGRELSEFAREVGAVMAKRNHWYLWSGEVSVIDTDPVTKASRFQQLDAASAVSSLEVVIQTGMITTDRESGERWFESASMKIETAALLLKSIQLKSCLPRVDRILEVPVPILGSDGNLVLPARGYNAATHIWVGHDAPDVVEIPLASARECLDWIQAGIAFAGEQDRVHYLANLVTPMAVGLMPSWNTRTPLFVYLGNRPRVGKDYAAGVIGVLFHGTAAEEAPLPADDAELWKRLVSGQRMGRRRLHFANCEGPIKSPVFEAIITNPQLNGRILGQSQDFIAPNETLVSLSGRTGLILSDDLEKRSRAISLTWAAEDINGRTFPIPDLHRKVLACRGQILSALYSIFLHWARKGYPAGPTPFASFPDWARVVGGIMVTAGLGDPCLPHRESLLPLDVVTADMRALFRLVHSTYPNQSLTSQQIMKFARSNAEGEIFTEYDFSKVGDCSRFGRLLRQYVNRVLGGIKLEFTPHPDRSERSTYSFISA